MTTPSYITNMIVDTTYAPKNVALLQTETPAMYVIYDTLNTQQKADLATLVAANNGSLPLKTMALTETVLTASGSTWWNAYQSLVHKTNVAFDASAAPASIDSGSRLYSNGHYINPLGVNLLDYFVDSEQTAIKTNVWTGVDISAFTAKLENALATHSDGPMLMVEAPAFFKVNRPVRYYGRVSVMASGASAGSLNSVIIFPDLSVDWSSTYPGRGVLETANFTYPTLPPGQLSWPNNKPDFCAMTGLWNIAIRCNFDSLFGTYPTRAPDYGFVVHSANEGWAAHRCNAFYAKKAGWLFSGFQSTPTLYNCGAFNTGVGVDTTFGATVTRTTGGAFSAPVSVFALVGGANTKVQLEAASNTDLASIIAGNVLSINGSSYTVSSATTPKLINQRTSIAGVVTSTIYVCHVTFSTSVTALTHGRVFHNGLAFTYHPVDAFAPGIISSDGGQACAGLINTFNFSGDNNVDGLFRMDSSGTVNANGPKGEYNGSYFLFNGNSNGGGKPKATITGYRAAMETSTHVDQSFIRMIGTCRPSVIALGGQADIAYANIVEENTDSGANNIVNAVGGHGLLAYCADSTEPAYIAQLNINGKVNNIDDGAYYALQAKSSANYRCRWYTVFAGTNTHRFQIGPAGSEKDIITIDGSTTPTAVHFKGYTGSAMQDMISFDNTGKMGFFNTTPAAKPTVTGSKSANVALASVITALATLGLITDSST